MHSTTPLDKRMDLPGMIFSSRVYQKYAHIFACAFEIPLFLDGGTRPLCADTQSPTQFCLSICQEQGCCSRCPLSKIPPLNRLEPWVWSRPCAVGLAVTCAPIRCGSGVYGWYVTGQHAAGIKPQFECTVTDALRDAGMDRLINDTSERLYASVRIIPEEKEKQVQQFLELMGAIVGAEMNSMLIEISNKERCMISNVKRVLRMKGKSAGLPEEIEDLFQRETGMPTKEYHQRYQLEEVRKEILQGRGEDWEIRNAAQRAGLWDGGHFQDLFQQFFHERPKEHVRRMQGVQHELWNWKSY